MINVTKTFFPPIEDYKHHLNRIWDNQWLTNNGKLNRELVIKLSDFLNRILIYGLPASFSPNLKCPAQIEGFKANMNKLVS